MATWDRLFESTYNLCAFFAIRFAPSPDRLPINKSRAENFDDAFCRTLRFLWLVVQSAASARLHEVGDGSDGPVRGS